jgi:hypothetical protein
MAMRSSGTKRITASRLSSSHEGDSCWRIASIPVLTRNPGLAPLTLRASLILVAHCDRAIPPTCPPWSLLQHLGRAVGGYPLRVEARLGTLELYATRGQSATRSGALFHRGMKVAHAHA